MKKNNYKTELRQVRKFTTKVANARLKARRAIVKVR